MQLACRYAVQNAGLGQAGIKMDLRSLWLKIRTQFVSFAVTKISNEPCVNTSIQPLLLCDSHRAPNLAFLQMVAIHGDKPRESHQGIKAFK